MSHIDEVFQWLAYAMVKRFNVQLIQFWTYSISRTGQRSVQLRMMVPQDPSLPEQIVVNDQIVLIAQRIVYEQQSIQPQPAANIFTHYQALLLQRHGLNYCAGNSFTANVLLPPRSNTSHEMLPSPLVMAILLFFRQSPHLDLVSTVGSVLEQAVILAGNRGLLLPATNVPPSFASPIPPPLVMQATLPQQVLPPLTELIPRRKQDANFLLTSSPFASSAVISDKQARRLHAAIDGHTNVSGLCNSTGMSIDTVYTALQTLLTQDRIEIYGPSGRIVDSSLFLKSR